jgi:hypothetical protein
MSTNNANRQRIDGHPGIYRITGKGDPRFQARYRDRITGKVVSRTFDTLAEAEAHKAAQLGFTYSVNAFVNGRFIDAWPIVPVDDETAATWPEMQDYIAEASSYPDFDPTSEAGRAELRKHAIELMLEEAADHAMSAITSDGFLGDVIAKRRTVTITIKVVRNPSDQELDEDVVRAYEGRR